jgi:aspartate kinase
MLEEMFARLFTIFENHRLHINLVHNSAVDIYIAVDTSWHIDDVVSELMATGFDVEKQENLEMITIRHYDDEIYRRYDLDENIIIKQVSPQSIRIVRNKIVN